VIKYHNYCIDIYPLHI